MSATDLRKKATTGGGYSALAAIAQKGLVVLQLAVLARLLEPVDFGVFSLGLVFLVGANTFTALGIEKLLVQRRELPASLVGSAHGTPRLRRTQARET